MIDFIKTDVVATNGKIKNICGRNGVPFIADQFTMLNKIDIKNTVASNIA